MLNIFITYSEYNIDLKKGSWTKFKEYLILYCFN